MSGNVLAIDQGTSGTKALVVCPDRGVLAEAEQPLRPHYGPGGAVEQDPVAMWDSVVAAGRSALAAAAEPVVAVGLANQGESVLAWDPEDGRPLTPVVVWQDRRSEAVVRRLADRADDVLTTTGLPLDAYFAAPKLAWVRENLCRDGVVGTTDAWLTARMTGTAVTDASTASRTALLDLGTTRWSATMTTAFGLGREPLPPVVDCAGRFGTTSVFGPEVPLTGLAVDQQAALLAQGCLDPGDAKCTYGTGAFVLVNTGGTPAVSRHGLSTSIAWRLGGETTYCQDGQVFTVASAVRWLADLGVVGGAAELDRVGGSVPDTGGVAFVPALAGLGAPWWRGDVRGALIGLGLDTTAGHLVRALCDGIAAQVVAAVAAAARETGVAVTRLLVDGGLTRSSLLMQAQADLLQRPVVVYASPHATALGVAALARLGLDGGSLREMVPPWRPAAVYEPAVPEALAAERLAAFERARAAAADAAVPRASGREAEA